ncbi:MULTISPECIES: sialidase family protein [Burkholderia]|jgi:photosystem II stability/assembly factor-like uncharacterized protein|uniref:Glycosyl hydrolase n=3 Tax=Bacteria TaxID=2 RepID=A0AAP1VCV1_9BURK|nr:MULTISPECIES: hypothetical protein [Burkholderia]EKS9800607.1 hypothetical protein [Burkholderia cepacia]EKS9807830.1 hypothetical protein [Burkholderia cepacia]EKS9815430.1 hypothetical protein [Burkholderia cepacia]EKS9821955.1 hypothetical protein [Burkholderia cepacia]EKS9829580.1 hypothetical protein [Burkholderia cepacia]
MKPKKDGKRRIFGRCNLPAHALSVVVVLFTGLLALHDASADALTTAARSPIVALGIDASHHVLLKATVDALYRSVDDGRHWNRIALPQTHGRVLAIATSARRPGLLYVGGPGLGVLRSDNDGQSWQSTNAGLPSRTVEALATHADQADTVYAYVAGRGIFRSQKDGRDWRLMDAGPRATILRLVHSNMPGSMQTGWLLAATSNGVSRSMDCFCGWRKAGGLTGKVDAVTYDPREPQQIYAALGKELLLSRDGGEQWTHLAAPGPAITALLVTPDGVLYAAGDGALFRRADHAGTWERLDG